MNNQGRLTVSPTKKGNSLKAVIAYIERNKLHMAQACVFYAATNLTINCATSNSETNKAGYTAISYGRVGRGGYTCFTTFRLVLTDRRTDKTSYRVACPQLKKLLRI